MKKLSLEYLKSLEGKFIQIIPLAFEDPIHFYETESDDCIEYIAKADANEIFMLVKTTIIYQAQYNEHFCAGLIDSSFKTGYTCYAWRSIKEIKVIE